MKFIAKLCRFGMATALVGSLIWSGGTALAQLSFARANGAAAALATLQPAGAIEGAVVGAAINGLPGAVWADRDNDGYADGYIQGGQYRAGTPPGYNAALRRVVSSVGAGIGGTAGASVVRPDAGIPIDTYVAPPIAAPPPPPPPPAPILDSEIPPPPPPPPPPPEPVPPVDSAPPGTCVGLPRFTLSPPMPSATMRTLSNSLFLRPGATLESVSDQLDSELEARGYSSGFFCVPGGFALATKLERIREDKRPYPGDARWVTDPQGLLDLREGFSLRRVFDALVNADPGRYRMLIFFVTDKPVTPTNQPPTAAILSLPDNAPDEVPAYYSQLPYTAAHRVRVLVYEFARPAVGAQPRVVRPTVSTRVHLERAGLVRLQQ